MSDVRTGAEGLRDQLAQKEAELSFQRRALAALQTLCESMGNLETMEEMFARTVGTLRELTGFANIALRLYDRQTHCLQLMAQVGMTPAMVDELGCLSADWGLLADVVREKKPVVSTNMPDEPERVGSTAIEAGYRSIVSVPLLAAGELVGSMELALMHAHTWSTDELQWLALLGRSLGMNIHQVRLTDQVRDLAVAQERARLGQEMHDSLGPLLGTMHVWAEEVQAALTDGDVAGARAGAAKIDSAAQEAYNVLREEILGLRMSLAPGEPLIPILRRYLDRFQTQWGIRSVLLLPDGADAAALSIEPSHEIQMLRVMHEALTNVRRHSRASQVVVALADSPRALTMTIEDDGVGFDVSRLDSDRFGIRIMRERAASVHGTLEIRSGPGQGTAVQMRILKPAPRSLRGES